MAGSLSPMPAAGERATSLQSSHRHHQGHRDPFQQLGSGSQLTHSLLFPLRKVPQPWCAEDIVQVPVLGLPGDVAKGRTLGRWWQD